MLRQAQHKYLVDFYHVCEYLSAAADTCGGAEKATWLEQQKTALKKGQAQTVLEALKPYCEPEDAACAPVRACHRYLSNRLKQLDYPGAQAKNLPIGSGEIESAHRYIIQNRLKRAGAWWKENIARDMLNLRVMRANGRWQDYWGDMRRAA